MKKTLLASAILLAFASSANAAITSINQDYEVTGSVELTNQNVNAKGDYTISGASGQKSESLVFNYETEFPRWTIRSEKKLTVKDLKSLSIYMAGGNASGAVYAYHGKDLAFSNIDSINIGSSDNQLAGFGALNSNGTLTMADVGSLSIYAKGSGIWVQPGVDDIQAKVDLSVKEQIAINTQGTGIGVSIFNGGTDDKDSASAILKAKNISLSSSRYATALYDYYNGKNGSGMIELDLQGEESVSVDGGYYGIWADRDCTANGKTRVNVESTSGDVTISGDYGAIYMDIVQENAATGTVSGKNVSLTSSDEFGRAIYTNNADLTINANDSLKINAYYALSLDGKSNLTMTANNIELTGDVYVGENSTLTMNGTAVVKDDMTVAGALGGDAELLVGNEDATVTIDTTTGSVTDGVTVGATGEVNDALGGDVSQLADNFVGFADGTEIQMAEGEVMGAVSATLDGEGVSGVKVAVNQKTEALAEQVTLAPQMITRILMNDVRKRMGDIRAAEGTHGVWARYNGGQMSGQGTDADFHMVQVGIDTVPVADAPRFGVAFSYAQTESEDNAGLATTDMDSFSLAFYGTKMYDNGMFVDVIGRMATMDTEMKIQDNEAKMDNVALSLSGELGWRFDVTDRFFFEPSVEATYTYTNADTFTMGKGTYQLEATDSLVGRAGFAAGFKCPANKGDVYVRAAVVHEFMGDTTMRSGTNGTFNGAPVEMDGEDTWFEYAIGAQFNVNKNTYVYADVERTEGAAMDEDWRANVGVRFAF